MVSRLVTTVTTGHVGNLRPAGSPGCLARLPRGGGRPFSVGVTATSFESSSQHALERGRGVRHARSRDLPDCRCGSRSRLRRASTQRGRARPHGVGRILLVLARTARSRLQTTRGPPKTPAPTGGPPFRALPTKRERTPLAVPPPPAVRRRLSGARATRRRSPSISETRKRVRTTSTLARASR